MKTMKLLNDFYYIKDRKCYSDTISCEVELCSDHPIYKAHFPNNPVVPGVCLVQIATELLQEITTLPLVLISATKIKYKNMVKPCDILYYEMSKTTLEKGYYKVRINIKGKDKDFAQMLLTYNNAKE